MSIRNRTYIDELILYTDNALCTLFGRPHITERLNPALHHLESDFTGAQRMHTARLMRINHTGEVCAQALYQGQALTAKLPEVRERMDRAAQEENDHLDWCESRLAQLGNRKSLLNPAWYAGSFFIGCLAGFAGDKWSLGFVVETERQVTNHLDSHLAQLATDDQRSRAILEQMREDELQHATTAIEAGGAELPWVIKKAMQLSSKIMTKSVYYL